MISIFEESSKGRIRPTNLKINPELVDNLKRADALGVWLYIRCNNTLATIERFKLQLRFEMEKDKLEEIIQYLNKEGAISIDPKNGVIRAHSSAESKEYTIPFQVSNKFSQQPSER